MSALASLRERLRALLFWSREDREMDEELAFHLDRETERLVESGLPPQQARRQASARFGSIQRCREEVRDERGLLAIESLRRDVRQTLTTFRRRPGVAALVVLTLAIGIAATATVLSLVHGVLLTPPPYHDPGRIALISTAPSSDDPDAGATSWAASDWRHWQEHARTIDVAAHRWSTGFLVSEQGSETIRGMWVTTNYFDVIGVAPLLGRTFENSVGGGEPSVILGYELWQRRFNGDRSVVGRHVRMGRGDVRVVGVMPPDIRFLPSPSAAHEPNYDVNAKVDFWTPVISATLAQRPGLDRRIWDVVARLRPDATTVHAQAELRQLQADARSSVVPRLESLTTILNAEAQTLLVPLAGGAGLLLLIACSNASALLLIRGVQRQQEFGVRTALGAGRLTLARQVGLEILLMALAGGVVGSLLAAAAVTSVRAIGGDAVPRADTLTVGWTIAAWGLAAAMVAAFLAGWLPVVRATNVDAGTSVKNVDHRTTAGRRERHLLGGIVLAQSALTLLLLVGAGLLVRTMYNLSQVRPGYDSSGVITMAVTAVGTDWASFHDRALRQVAQVPGVESAAFAWGVPLTGDNWRREVDIDGATLSRAGEPVTIPVRAVTPGYFALLEIPLLAGRDFDARDQAKMPVAAVVNRAFAERYFPGADPLGRRIRDVATPTRTAQIVGVVGDLRANELTVAPEPEVYFSLWQFPADTKHLVVRAVADAAGVTRDLHRVLRSIDPTVAVEDIRTLDAIRDASVARRRFVANLLLAFALAATVLTACGIYGVVALWVAARRREVAIRFAVGAGRAAVLRMVVREGLQLVAAGIAVGLAAAALLSSALQAFLFEVGPNDPLTMVTAAVAFLTGALCCCLIPAVRAARVNPVDALRHT